MFSPDVFDGKKITHFPNSSSYCRQLHFPSQTLLWQECKKQNWLDQIRLDREPGDEKLLLLSFRPFRAISNLHPSHPGMLHHCWILLQVAIPCLSISPCSLCFQAHFAPMCPSSTGSGAPEKWHISVYTIWQHTLGSLGIKIAGSVHFTITRMMMTIHFPLKAFFFCFFPFVLMQ